MKEEYYNKYIEEKDQPKYLSNQLNNVTEERIMQIHLFYFVLGWTNHWINEQTLQERKPIKTNKQTNKKIKNIKTIMRYFHSNKQTNKMKQINQCMTK